MDEKFEERVMQIIKENLKIEISKYSDYGESGISVRLVLFYETISEDKVALISWED